MQTPLLVLALFTAFPMVAFLSSVGEPIAHRAVGNPVIYEGKITGWSVSADGTVAVRLAGTHASKEFALWFATPASRNATTRYENLVLDAVLAVSGALQSELVTVVTDNSNETSGKSVEDAMTLNSIAHL